MKINEVDERVVAFAQLIDDLVKDESLPWTVRLAALKAGGGLVDLVRELHQELKRG